MSNGSATGGSNPRAVAAIVEQGRLYVDLDEYNAMLSTTLQAETGRILFRALMTAVPEIRLLVGGPEDYLVEQIIDVVERLEITVERMPSQPTGGELIGMEDISVTYSFRASED